MSGYEVVTEGNSAPAPDPVEAPEGSLLSRLRKAAVEQQRERTLDVDIGGAFAELGVPLVARYAPLPIDELERYTELVGTTGNVELAIDLVVRCNVAMLVRDGDRLEELRDADGLVTFGPRLARLLEFPIPASVPEPTAREVARWLFGDNGYAFGAHVQRVVEWMGAESPGPTSPTNGSSSSAAPRSSASPHSSS